MIILWDEPKRQANLAKHGLDFADLNEAFFANAVFVPGKNNRWRGIGVDVDGVICVVFARYGQEGVSVISMRPANLAERNLYRDSLKKD